MFTNSFTHQYKTLDQRVQPVDDSHYSVYIPIAVTSVMSEMTLTIKLCPKVASCRRRAKEGSR